VAFKRDLEFYDIQPEDFRLDEALSNINKMPSDSSPTGSVLVGDGMAITIGKNFENTNEHCCGIISRYRMDDLPGYGSPQQRSISQLKLSKNEGIADTTYFHYDKSLKILCLLPGKTGVKWGTFSWYVHEKGNPPQDFSLLPLITADAMKIFQSWGSLTSVALDVKVGNATRASSQTVQNLPVGAMLTGARQNLNVSTVKIELLSKKRNGGFPLTKGKQLVTALKSIAGIAPGAEIKSLRVKGSAEAETHDNVIDLVKQRYKVTLELDGSNRILNFDECKKTVRKAIDDCRRDLKELIE